MKTRFFKFEDKQQAITVFTEAGLYSPEEGFSNLGVFGKNSACAFAFIKASSFSDVVYNDDGTDIVPDTAAMQAEEQEEPSSYLVNGVGDIPEELDSYEIFPETPYNLFV